MQRDPYRVNKEEFLHKLYERHKGHPVGSLEVSEMAAAKMLVTDAMHKQGIVLSAGETVNIVGEMARMVGGDTTLAARQIVSQMDYEKRKKKAGGLQERNEARARELLMAQNSKTRR